MRPDARAIARAAGDRGLNHGSSLLLYSLRVTGVGSIFSRPDPVSLRNIRAFVDALRTNMGGSDIPASDEGIRTILELTCGQFDLRIEPKETILLVGPTRRHGVKKNESPFSMQGSAQTPSGYCFATLCMRAFRALLLLDCLEWVASAHEWRELGDSEVDLAVVRAVDQALLDQ
jgi:hypothetical protein